MPFRRGFKSQCERRAAEFRKQFGLSDQGALSADRLAKELRVTVCVIVVLIMRFRRRGCFLGGFSSVNYEISTGTLGQSLLVDCVALLLFQNSRSVRQ